MKRRKLLSRLVKGALPNVAFTDKDYHINVFYSAEDGGYIADIPDLEACSAFGSTPEAALAEVRRAKSAWLAAARQKHKPIPRSRYRPVIYQVSDLRLAR